MGEINLKMDDKIDSTSSDEKKIVITEDSIEKTVEDVTKKVAEDSEEKVKEAIEEESNPAAASTKMNQHDIFKLFFFVYIFALVIMVGEFVTYLISGKILDIDLSKFAITLNVAIVFIGSAEGIRSFAKTATSDDSQPVPAYKLKYLFTYLISFAVITIIALGFECVIKVKFKDAVSIPNFCSNQFVDGLLSNTIAYLIARYGNKVAENIDLTNLPFFKKKVGK